MFCYSLIKDNSVQKHIIMEDQLSKEMAKGKSSMAVTLKKYCKPKAEAYFLCQTFTGRDYYVTINSIIW